MSNFKKEQTGYNGVSQANIEKMTKYTENGIVKSHVKRNFTMVSNLISQSIELTAIEKALWIVLEGLPDNFNVSLERISGLYMRESSKTLKRAARNLEKYGFLYRERKSTGHVIYHLFDDIEECKQLVTRIGKPKGKFVPGAICPGDKLPPINNTEFFKNNNKNNNNILSEVPSDEKNKTTKIKGKSKKRSRANIKDFPEKFQKAYLAYPSKRRKGINVTFKCWTKILKKHDLTEDQLLEWTELAIETFKIEASSIGFYPVTTSLYGIDFDYSEIERFKSVIEGKSVGNSEQLNHNADVSKMVEEPVNWRYKLTVAKSKGLLTESQFQKAKSASEWRYVASEYKQIISQIEEEPKEKKESKVEITFNQIKEFAYNDYSDNEIFVSDVKDVECGLMDESEFSNKYSFLYDEYLIEADRIKRNIIGKDKKVEDDIIKKYDPIKTIKQINYDDNGTDKSFLVID